MELFETNFHFILSEGYHSLWCSRADGSILARNGEDIDSIPDAVCLGKVYGFLGKIQIQSESDPKLILIKQRSLVGQLPGGHDVYKINKIVILSLSLDDTALVDLSIEPCKKHNATRKNTRNNSSAVSVASDLQQKAFQKTWNTIKTATANVKTVTANVKLRKNDGRYKEKLERRIMDELIKMFQETDSFYYSVTGDLTNSIQRQYLQRNRDKDTNKSVRKYIPLWKRIDDRFFWNKYMVQDLVDSENQACDYWILPIIQGYVQVNKCHIDSATLDHISYEENTTNSGVLPMSTKLHTYKMILISRRSRLRAGTRYKRRGVDENGNCANYVETEQIFEYASHVVSFTQVRGSVPVYWSQPGYKYRPPPHLDKNEEESQVAFAKHFDAELDIYGTQTIISLVEQLGREKVIADSYLHHIISYNNPKLTYVSFDFHEYCRGMKFENVSILIESIQDIIRETKYCWMDKQGMICEQQGTFRVNCIDCLDRTNIVQTALAKAIMDSQLIKLGLLPPEGILPANCRLTFQQMWANNGDIISRQYAGTAALKGDYTRTGERRLAGMMKDGYNSANRYYLNRFRDAHRQAAIDLMIGNPISEDFSELLSPDKEAAINEFSEEEQLHQEHVKQIIDDCKKMLVPELDVVLGGWALIDADPVSGDPSHNDMDTILLLTKDSYYVAEYDDDTDRITRYQRILLEDLEKIELGPEPSLFKSKFFCIRLHYTVNGQPGYFHTFRSTSLRFFNNVAVSVLGQEDTVEALKAISETFKVALSLNSLAVPFYQGKLDRRKSKLPFSQGGAGATHRNMLGAINLELPNFNRMTRNVSESQLLAIRDAGARAFNNMSSVTSQLVIKPSKAISQQFAKALSPIQGFRSNVFPGTTFEFERPQFHVESSSDSEDSDQNKNRQPNVVSAAVVAPSEASKVRERIVSSEYSDVGSSDFEEYDVDVLDGDRLRRQTTGSNSSADDVLLQSCGILATGSSSDRIRRRKYSSSSSLIFVDDHFSTLSVDGGRRCRHEVDDFMVDSMRKAVSMRHIHGSKKMLSSGGSVTGFAVCSIGSVPSMESGKQLANSKGNIRYARPPEILVFPEELSASESSLPTNQRKQDYPSSQMKPLSKSSENIEVRAGVSTGNKDGQTDATRRRSQPYSDGQETWQRNIDDRCLNFGAGTSGNLIPADKDLLSKMKLSHSESAIQEYSTVPNPSANDSMATSSANKVLGMFNSNSSHGSNNPTISFKRDLVLSPLSKIARGVHNLGQSVKTGVGVVVQQQRNQTDTLIVDDAEYNRKKALRRGCLSRIIEL
ncbi:INPP5F (predicted) [Pycnogonum litorale]